MKKEHLDIYAEVMQEIVGGLVKIYMRKERRDLKWILSN